MLEPQEKMVRWSGMLVLIWMVFAHIFCSLPVSDSVVGSEVRGGEVKCPRGRSEGINKGVLDWQSGTGGYIVSWVCHCVRKKVDLPKKNEISVLKHCLVDNLESVCEGQVLLSKVKERRDK
jgi:hypothetical protein